MKLGKRSLVLATALMLALSMSVFGTIAYLTHTAQATNTFTVGDVEITLDETDVDEDGNPKYPVDTNGDGEPDRIIIVDQEDGTITIIDPTVTDDPTTPEDESVIGVITPNEDGTYPDEMDTDGDGEPDAPIDIDGDGDSDTVKVDEDGNVVVDEGTDDEQVIEPGRDNENDYNLVPGADYLKDPTVTVLKDSEECYVRMRVGFSSLPDGMDAEIMFYSLVKDLNEESWDFKYVNDDGELEFWYVEDGEFVTVEPTKAADLVLPPLFTTVGVPGEVTGDELQGMAGVQMIIEGDAIQSASFENAAEAWEAFDGQNQTVD